MTRVAEVWAAGGEVWFADETTLREFPPLRAAWSRKREQAIVLISGRNTRRVLIGLLNVITGEVRPVVREHGRGADVAAGLSVLGPAVPGVPRLLILDNAPAQQTRLVRETAAAVGIELCKLPFRSPELNPLEDVWRDLKRVVAANRVYPVIDELVGHALAYLASLTPEQVLRLAGLRSSKFDWLPT